MQFRRLNATFGCLERRALEFSPGLNIIEAPNESGKSTLAAFLKTMLYGWPQRDRSKDRYAPWSGAPMQGTLEVDSERFGAVALRRDSPRPAKPMGRFTATYAGTGDEVPGLTAADCGEQLLGVPREVYERSAFIRQSGMAVEQDAELERRAAALVSTGEEGRSYSETAAALKKQLNARRANSRSGRIPALEQEIADDETALAEVRELLDERESAERALAELQEQEARLKAQLKAHDVADRREQYLKREQARHDADAKDREIRSFRRMLADANTPNREVLEENRGRLRTAEGQEQQHEGAESARSEADAALQAHRNEPAPAVLAPPALLWLALFLVSCGFAIAPWLRPSAFPPALRWAAAAAALFAALFIVIVRRGILLRQEHARRLDELSAALREAEAACAALQNTIDATMAQVRADIPAADAEGAAAYINENLARYDNLARMEDEARSLRLVYESTPKPDLAGVPAFAAARPERSVAELRGDLDDLARQRAEAQSRADRAAGRLSALPDAAELDDSLARKRAELAEAAADYDAIRLAMDTLEQANGELQSRFSPALGRRAAAYFAALTGEKYEAVALDRGFRALATESGESAARDAALLSQGAADQLYLAVRLAICDQVLPESPLAPLVLDDALTSFDDERCEAALELLLKEAERRQILLLTCQHREAAYLEGRGAHIAAL